MRSSARRAQYGLAPRSPASPHARNPLPLHKGLRAGARVAVPNGYDMSLPSNTKCKTRTNVFSAHPTRVTPRTHDQLHNARTTRHESAARRALAIQYRHPRAGVPLHWAADRRSGRPASPISYLLPVRPASGAVAIAAALAAALGSRCGNGRLGGGTLGTCKGGRRFVDRVGLEHRVGVRGRRTPAAVDRPHVPCVVERVDGSRDSEATTHVQAAEAALLGA
jgi:hypothetical protein